MIGYISGEVLDNSEGRLLIGVGDRNVSGVVGYTVSVPQHGSYDTYLKGQKVEVFIYTHVREEAFDLYGFQTPIDKTLFLTLLTVNGIGPKSAMGILSAVGTQDLIQAIVRGDQAYLTSIPGIGKKTAERVVVELRDSVKKKVDLGVFSVAGEQKKSSSLKGTRVGNSNSITDGIENEFNEAELIRDAKSALIGLGYKEQEAQTMVNRALHSQDFHPAKPEDLIRTALRQLV